MEATTRRALDELAAFHQRELLLHALPVIAVGALGPSAWFYATGAIGVLLFAALAASAVGLVAYAGLCVRRLIATYTSMDCTLENLASALAETADDVSQRALALPLATLGLASAVRIDVGLLALALAVHALNMLASWRTRRALEHAISGLRARPLVYADLSETVVVWNWLGVVSLRRYEPE